MIKINGNKDNKKQRFFIAIKESLKGFYVILLVGSVCILILVVLMLIVK